MSDLEQVSTNDNGEDLALICYALKYKNNSINKDTESNRKRGYNQKDAGE